MRPDHFGNGRRRVQRECFVSHRYRTIEVAGGGVRDSEHIKSVGVAAQGEHDRTVREADCFFGTSNRRLWRRGEKRRQARNRRHSVRIQRQYASEVRDGLRNVSKRARDQTDIQMRFA